MKNIYSLFYLSFLLLWGCMQVHAQTGRFYSTENGLSSSMVNQLFQDSRGFVWSATEYGLNRFDGMRFSNYYHVSSDTSSIKNNYVRTLFEDTRQRLMVGCIDGLMLYNRETDTFMQVPLPMFISDLACAVQQYAPCG